MTAPIVLDRPTLFGREPALLLSFVNGAVVLFSALVLPLDTVQQGVLNAVASAVLGLAIAAKVKGGTWAAASIALLQALIAAALAFGLALSPETQSSVMLFATVALGLFTRQVVTAPQSAPAPGSSAVA